MSLSILESPRPGADLDVPLPSITVIVPTFREVLNVPVLLKRIAQVREAQGLDLSLLIMDDDSRDGSAEAVLAAGYPWATLVTRTQDRGLSAAVIDGFQRATGDVLVCMDADLSHPPEQVPSLVRTLLEHRLDFVIGSRYVEGGTTSHDWGFLRWINSQVATLLARPFTKVSDPMSGFFALRRATFEQAAPLEPIGYKIGLELIVKGHCKHVGEIPIHFEDRQLGESKLTLAQQMLYLRHLRRLAIFKYGVWSHFMQFLAVGALGVFVNLAFLTLFTAFGIHERAAIGLAIAFSIVFNFVLNRRFSFSYARSGAWARQLVGYFLASAAGATVNYLVTLNVRAKLPELPVQAAALAGIAAGTLLNFFFSRYLVFRVKHIRQRK